MEAYSVGKEIGRGSYASVYLVQEKRTGEKFVMKKIILKDLSPKDVAASKQEVDLLRKLDHPYIVSYKDSFFDSRKENLCIVQTFCDGGDISTRVRDARGKRFPEDQILEWFVQILLALHSIHRKKILHRDLKTQNIFLVKKDESVRLGDFGIARVLNSTVALAHTAIGTPLYMSPEVCRNQPYGFKSDVWALGCVLYELTTLKHAFDARNLNGLIMKIIRGTFAPIPFSYSTKLDDLIRKMLARQSSSRPSVTEICRMPFVRRKIHEFIIKKLDLPSSSLTAEGRTSLIEQLQMIGFTSLPIALPSAPAPAPAPSSTSLSEGKVGRDGKMEKIGEEFDEARKREKAIALEEKRKRALKELDDQKAEQDKVKKVLDQLKGERERRIEDRRKRRIMAAESHRRKNEVMNVRERDLIAKQERADKLREKNRQMVAARARQRRVQPYPRTGGVVRPSKYPSTRKDSVERGGKPPPHAALGSEKDEDIAEVRALGRGDDEEDGGRDGDGDEDGEDESVIVVNDDDDGDGIGYGSKHDGESLEVDESEAADRRSSDVEYDRMRKQRMQLEEEVEQIQSQIDRLKASAMPQPRSTPEMSDPSRPPQPRRKRDVRPPIGEFPIHHEPKFVSPVVRRSRSYSGGRKETAGVASSPSTRPSDAMIARMTPKERVLHMKEIKRKEEEENQKRLLAQARGEYYQRRLKADAKTKAEYHSHVAFAPRPVFHSPPKYEERPSIVRRTPPPPLPLPHDERPVGGAPRAPSVARDDVFGLQSPSHRRGIGVGIYGDIEDENDVEDDMDDGDDDDDNDDVAADDEEAKKIGREIAEKEQEWEKRTRRVMELQRSIEAGKLGDLFDDDEDEDEDELPTWAPPEADIDEFPTVDDENAQDEDDPTGRSLYPSRSDRLEDGDAVVMGAGGDGETESRDDAKQHVGGGLGERRRRLREECIRGLGPVLFDRAYAFAKAHYACGCEDDDRLERGLQRLLGEERMRYWPLLDQIVFIEVYE